jgi:tetratricopeptide (TPR) repeat protein
MQSLSQHRTRPSCITAVLFFFGTIGCQTGPTPKAQSPALVPPLESTEKTPAPDTDRLPSAEAYLLYLQSELHVAEGDTLAAIDILREAQSYDPNSAYLYTRLSELYLEVGNVERSELASREVLKIDPNHIPALRLNAYALHLSDQNEDARELLQQILELSPGHRPASALLADVYLDEGQIHLAEKVIQDLMQHEPGAIDGYLTLAGLFAKRGNWKLSDQYIDKAIERDARSVEALDKKIALLHSRGNFKESLVFVERLFSERGDTHRQRYQLLVNLLLADQTEAAKNMVDVWLQENKSERLYMLIANAHEAAGETDRALEILLSLEKASASPELKSNIGRLLMAGGWYAKSIDYLCHDTIRSQNSDWALHLISMCTKAHLYAGDTLSAWKFVEEARITQPYSWRLLRAQLEISEYPDTPISTEEVLSDVQSARAVQPADYSLLELEVEALELLGRSQLAAETIDAAVRSHPNYTELLMIQARFLERNGNPNGAIRVIEKILVDLDTPSVDHLNFAAYTLADHNQSIQEAISLAWSALLRDPLNGFIVDTLGWAEFRSGDLEQSRITLLRANRLSPREPEILMHLAMVHLSLGQQDIANTYVEKGLECVTFSDPVRLQLETLLENRGFY